MPGLFEKELKATERSLRGVHLASQNHRADQERKKKVKVVNKNIRKLIELITVKR